MTNHIPTTSRYSEIPLVKIIKEKDDLEISCLSDRFTISWKNSQLEKTITWSLNFIWRGIKINLHIFEHLGANSETISIKLYSDDKTYEYGVAKGSIGAGTLGTRPKLEVGSHKLDFSFGKNKITIIDKSLNSEEHEENNAKNPEFQFIL